MGGKKRVNPSFSPVKLPYTVVCDAKGRPQLVKLQRMGARVCIPRTPTLNLTHLWLRDHCGRGGRKIVRARTGA